MHHMNWLLLLSMLLILNACVESEKDLAAYVNQVKQTPKGKIETIPPGQKFKQVDYTAQAMRSPFMLTQGSFENTPQLLLGPNGETIRQQPRPDTDRPREYLEQFPLSSLAMVGTMSKPEMNWGLITDDRGMVHAVKVGDYIGQNSGKIIAVTPDQIRLTELVPNGTGGWMQIRASLNLVQAPAEAQTQSPLQPAQTAKQPKTGQQKAGQRVPTQSQPQTQQRGQPQGRTGGGGAGIGARGG